MPHAQQPAMNEARCLNQRRTFHFSSSKSPLTHMIHTSLTSGDRDFSPPGRVLSQEDGVGASKRVSPHSTPLGCDAINKKAILEGRKEVMTDGRIVAAQWPH